MIIADADQIIDQVFARFSAHGHRSYGESVTELEHALQSATFAQRDGRPADMVAACLLHDYGHLCHDLGEDIASQGVDAGHEALGAVALAHIFPRSVVEPVRLHVAAKRYLCTTDAAYLAGLSQSSALSFQLQGGPMDASERRAFEAEPFFADAVTLRRYDDLAKVPGMETPGLEAFRGILQDVLVASSTAHVADIAKGGLIETGRMFHTRGWSLATSSNYSVVLDEAPLRILVTASGKDKGRLTPADFVLIDEHGAVLEGAGRPSAEALLHVAIAHALPGVGAILHTHSMWGTVLSDLYYPDGALILEGYEMLKGLEGVSTHEQAISVPIFENTQHIPDLAQEIEALLANTTGSMIHGFLIRRHGLYTWGRTHEEARRHIEAFEFLFEVAGRRLSLDGTRAAGLAPPGSQHRS